jgi:hypothetical protein
VTGVNHKCPACGIVWSCLGCFEREPRCSDCKAKPVAAIEARNEHAALRLRFALALAPAFPDLALASARAHNLRGDDFSPVLQVFDLADALATEHERRCAEEAKVPR